MKRLSKLALAMSLVLVCTSCVTTSPDDADNAASPTEDISSLDKGNAAAATDSSLEADLNQTGQPAAAQSSAAQAPVEPAKAPTDAMADNELDVPAEAPQQAATTPPQDEFAQFDNQDKAAEAQPPAPAPEEKKAEEKKEEIPPPPVVAETQPPEPAPEPPAEAIQPNTGLITIKSIDFKGNDNGGTVVVEADGPMTYSTRMSTGTGQYIIDIPNSILPKKLTRSMVTKDFEGMIGAIDAYQASGSNVSRIVVHLKPGAPEPVIQTEGSTLLVVENLPPQPPKPEMPKEEVRLMSYDNLEEFMAGEMTFSGKKISLETGKTDVRAIFRYISDEVGVNLIISDDVKGDMAVKLKQVPWDQVMVMVMKANKLSFTRTGNVLRIVPIEQLRKEEGDYVKMIADRKTVAPLIVKVIPISYAKMTDLKDQVTPFLTKDRGTVIIDTRTNALVISDVQESIDRIQKLVASLDIPPQQVLIEGKIVEAQEDFQRQVGIQWNFGGMPVGLGGSSAGSINSLTGVTVSPGTTTTPSAQVNFSIGVLDVLGSLNATLSLQESEGLVKVLSSPRVVTLHNQQAEITQTQEIPLITSIVSAGVVTNTVTFKPVKLDLKVTPNVTNDGAVIMKIDVTREFAGGIVDPNTQARPVNGRTAGTNVMVKNGQTAVIGGIYQDDSTDTEIRFPWLGSIPIVGWLFRNKAQTETKNELLIFVTPRILGQLDSQTIPSQHQSDQDIQ